STFGRDVEPLAERLQAAFVRTIDDCMRLGQLDQLPGLLKRAAELIDDGDRSARSQLLKRARDAYAILADDKILRVLLDLRNAHEPSAVDEEESTIEHPLGLFAAATVAGALPSGATWLPALSPGRSLAELEDDARLRGCWLALSTLPFTLTTV